LRPPHAETWKRTVSDRVCEVTTDGAIDWRSMFSRAGWLICEGWIVPFPAGQPVGGAGAAATMPVGLEALVPEPLAFLAVTRTRIRRPWSAVVKLYA
jgi:hypothetical protein